MTERDIAITINGTDHEMAVEPRRLLAHVLRDLGYTGVKVGCETSLCGACTVHLNGEPVKSCTTFAVQADGEEVTTVEGLTQDGDLHPVQESFHEEHGLQCGYCTPGMLMTTTALLEENPDPSEAEIRNGLKGNLCRCTGYQNIVESVKTASKRFPEE